MNTIHQNITQMDDNITEILSQLRNAVILKAALSVGNIHMIISEKYQTGMLWITQFSSTASLLDWVFVVAAVLSFFFFKRSFQLLNKHYKYTIHVE